MKRYLFVLIIVLLNLTSCKNQANYTQKNKIYDDKNVEIDISSIPQRVITTSPSLTEIIFDLNEGNKIVGNTTYCDFPEAAKSITKIGNILSIDYEKVVSLKPDVIFMLQLHGSEIHYPKLTELGQKIYFFKINNYNDLCRVYRIIGKIFHKEKLAELNIKRWNQTIDSLKVNIKTKNKALFLVSAFPIVAASDKSFINDIIKFAGFENICSNVPNEYPLYSEEKILELNPDYIFVRDDIGEILKKYKSWSKLNAFKNNNVYLYNENLYHRPGPRFIQAVQELNRVFIK
ncbi:MAG TPA: helical backbone metal receptor [Ignavibacteriales bacterium]|nr:helical backbone metal receptor [Ignavibacteriales bacterium]HPD66833.1 helical backbone metal receptor [Ignavibacteriales bacterium]HRR18216.1 helical backbone metal receptor [Ignavibacteriales bacterium]HRU00023.1 helical backbone metal receptor [Ignavibacteriales bacterium]